MPLVNAGIDLLKFYSKKCIAGCKNCIQRIFRKQIQIKPTQMVISQVENDDLKLISESEYHEMSYVDKRKKDREFGRFIKTAIKQNRK
jgi:hypothetical protein